MSDTGSDTSSNSTKLLTLLEIEEIDKLIRARKRIFEKNRNDQKKLVQMTKNVPNLVDLAEPCTICTDPLLQDIGKVSFGVISYSCKCTVVRTIHTKCWLSQEGSVPKCAYCRTRVVLVVPTLVGGSSRVKTIFCTNDADNNN